MNILFKLRNLKRVYSQNLLQRKVVKDDHKLAIYKSNINHASELKTELFLIEEKINSITRDLLESEFSGLKSSLIYDQSFWNRFSRNWYPKSAKESSRWHRDRLLTLYKERNLIQIELDKITGNYWLNLLKRWLIYFALISILALFIFFIIMGLLTALYFLPFFALTIGLYWFFKKKIK